MMSKHVNSLFKQYLYQQLYLYKCTICIYNIRASIYRYCCLISMHILRAALYSCETTAANICLDMYMIYINNMLIHYYMASKKTVLQNNCSFKHPFWYAIPGLEY